MAPRGVSATGSTRVTTPTTNAALDEEVRRLRAKEAFDSNCRDWCKRIKTLVSKELFHLQQMICSKTDDEFGTEWQDLVCSSLKVPEEQQYEFWTRSHWGGMKEAKKQLGIKRMNMTGAMKIEFFSKCLKKCWDGQNRRRDRRRANLQNTYCFP
jgi:hypothetical protein